LHPVQTKRAAVKVNPDAEVWAALLKYMRAHQPAICRQWFDHLEPLGVGGGVLRVRAHSDVHRDYLQRACVGPFNDAAQIATGRLISVRFYGPDENVEVATGVTTTPAPMAASVAAPANGQGPSGGRPGDRTAAGMMSNTISHAPEPAKAGQSGREGAGFAGRVTSGVNAAPSAEGPVAAGPGSGNQGGAAPSAADQEPDQNIRGAQPAGDDAGPGERVVPWSPAETLILPKSAVVEPPLYDDGLVLNPDYGFDNFVVGPNNRLAHAAALAVSANPGRAYNPFFVHGDVGLGKTHLLQAICLAIRAQRPGAVIYYTSCEGFMTQFMDAVAAGAMTRFRHKFRHVDVLVVDDIHFLAKRDRTQEEFFHTFNSLYQSHKQIVLSSDAPPEEIPDLEDRLVSRFKWGLVAPISPPTYETRIEIVKNKARLRGLELPGEVAEAIAARIDANIRELEGAVTKLQVLAQLEKQPMTAELVRQALGAPERKPEATVQIQTIINAVTEFYQVKVTDLQSKRRQRSIALPRQLCMYLARRHTRFSLEEIGGYFGGRDHTTVMHAVKTIETRVGSDGDFAQQVTGLETRLRGA
jgi:chromosomal replication initiator protein